MSEDCPGLACFELLGRKWTAQIVWVLLDGPRRFSSLLEAVPGLSDKMLTRRLDELAALGIVTRTQFAEIPPRVEYALSPAGLALRGVIVEMERWSGEHAVVAQATR
jgi:DNA-binding HxlR family transcriptional regulator